MDPGEDFADAKGFGYIIVSTEIEADNGIDFLGLGGEKEEGDVFIGFTDSTADFVAIETWHHDVEADEVGGRLLVELPSCLAIGGGRDLEAILLKNSDESFAGVGVVFGDENVKIGGHRVVLVEPIMSWRELFLIYVSEIGLLKGARGESRGRWLQGARPRGLIGRVGVLDPFFRVLG